MSTLIQKVIRWVHEWSGVLPFLIAGVAATIVVLVPRTEEVVVFPAAETRDALFKRFGKTFDSERAHVIVSSTCLDLAEEAFFFSRDPTYTPGDIGAPHTPVWNDLSPGAAPSMCGVFLRGLKENKVPFHLYLSTDGGLGEALAKVVRRYVAGELYPIVLVDRRLVEAVPSSVLVALQPRP